MGLDNETPTKSVLITGSSTGIGEACAIALHDKGIRVFAGVRRQEDGERLVKQTSAALIPLLLDVTDEQAIKKATQQITDATAGGGLSGLVNNAGITIAFPLEFLPMDVLRKQLEVNVIGPAAVTQAMLPLIRQGQGRIVNVSSISGLAAAPYIGAYAASKHALEAMSDSLRVELRNFAVPVSLVEPADVATPIWEKSRQAANDLRSEVMDRGEGDDVSEEVREAYARDIAAMREATSKSEKQAIPVSHVVKAIEHALLARRPKTRYLVGGKTRAVKFFLRHLPDRLRDRIVMNSLGMK
ncbi:MAG: SDR family oxidoreductase [Planctomycetes bacterium]|nr:SDR family oxidoreductase [Planctomycetota bacterium]